jgi:tetratricopeptide (TPR) repeat protein
MPTTADALTQGLECFERGAFGEAEEFFRQALEADPHNAEAHYHLGLALANQGRLTDAVASFQQALYWRPGYPEAYSALGATFQLAVQDRTPAVPARTETRPATEAARAVIPDAVYHIPPLKHENADQLNTPEEYHERARIRHSEGRVEEALADEHQALRLNPYFVEAYCCLQVILRAEGRIDEAIACSYKALRLKPEDPQAHLVRAQTLLYFGDYEQGWKEYEWRTSSPTFGVHPISLPRPAWDGSPLNGRILFLRSEQGMGDTIQFIRYADVLKQQGGRVMVECQPPLVSLLRSCPAIETVIVPGDVPPHYDVYALLLSLPKLLGTTLDTIPTDIPYLFPDPELVERWRKELSGIEGFKVGIVWQGNTMHKMDNMRSVPLTQFDALAKIPGVQLVSLQLGEGSEQLAALDGRFPVIDLGSRFDPESMADAAAAMKNLDLVITVDTAIGHLAGALGVPVWVALSFSPDWRWMLHRTDSPWYPTLRLFRQTQPANFTEVFERIAEQLAKEVSRGGTS